MAAEAGPILFYGRHTPFYEFSNFYPCVLLIDGLQWPNSESYYQAEKFVLRNRHLREQIRKARNPTLAKRVAYSVPCDPDWDTRKVEVMRRVLRCKFACPTLKALLLGTGKRTLVEHTKNDKFWGDGGDGSGQNMLGKMLMELREELMSAQPPTMGA
jgi:ribA/ribD-fused uncharacterized protein